MKFILMCVFFSLKAQYIVSKLFTWCSQYKGANHLHVHVFVFTYSGLLSIRISNCSINAFTLVEFALNFP